MTWHNRWPKTTMAERFWAKVERGDNCWLWTAAADRRGYGRFQRGTGMGTCFAHRLAWELTNGPIPQGMEIDHRCFTPACVRPDHLALIEPGPHRRQAGERRRELAPDHCKWGHPFTMVVAGRRRCRPCTKERWTKDNWKRRGMPVRLHGRSEDITPDDER